MYTNNEVKLYFINELENNPNLLANLNSEQLKVVSALIKNKDKLHIDKINPETGIAIDSNHKVITAIYNETTNEFDISEPEQYNYSNDVESVYDGYNVEDIEIANDIPKVIDGVEIDIEKVQLLYEYPEIIDKEDVMPPKQKNAYIMALQIYKQIFARRVKNQQNSKQKIFVKTTDYKKAGFMDIILLAGITGFFGGVMTMIILSIISK